ncbi:MULTISPECIES: Bug family tripartite tricarboxylate transporter substrate binding protein [Variovorax]|uniref:Bug family tripartite tricarboxylate transporter substrate binding protein n=1 Tax=Variovorax TaxID=34072 RepID=UPI000AD8B560|nr:MULTISPECIES: tripartite tricarboxylate transporter substrate binding protein [Variovorax]MBN8752855.1 tripartite tricarboxylate transporter substrate binding protein [Variovorax sp.]UKI07993.1 tripartite tricarboxylate transporter substrate binding protein [Variovorax paradoxus]
MTRQSTRSLAAGVAMLAALCSAAPAHAQSASPASPAYPAKAVRIIIGTPPGDSADASARSLAAQLARETGQPFFVDNKPGAHGIIASEAAKNAAPDGYTLLLSTGGPMAINPSLYKKLPYDPLKSFEPVVPLSTGPLYLVVNNDLPVKNLKDLVAYAKAHPGKMSYGSGGSGTTQHLAMETLKKSMGLDILHVPYKGSPAVLQDLIGGQIQLAFDAGASILPQIRNGKVRLIGVASDARSPLTPDMPTLTEQGVPAFRAVVWSGLFVPAGTPSTAVAKLNTLVNQALRDPAFAAQMRAQGGEPAGGGSAEFRSFLQAEISRWAKAVADSGATID